MYYICILTLLMNQSLLSPAGTDAFVVRDKIPRTPISKPLCRGGQGTHVHLFSHNAHSVCWFSLMWNWVGTNGFDVVLALPKICIGHFPVYKINVCIPSN